VIDNTIILAIVKWSKKKKLVDQEQEKEKGSSSKKELKSQGETHAPRQNKMRMFPKIPPYLIHPKPQTCNAFRPRAAGKQENATK
jgi:hypothetical protein